MDAARGSLAGTVAIITGGGRGIGRATADLFAREGAKLVIATRNAVSGIEAIEAIAAAGGEAHFVETQLDSRAAVRAVVDAAIERFGRLDVVLHNAATMTPGSLAQISDEVLDDVLTVNLKAAFWFAAEALQPLTDSGRGRLLFTSSITGTEQAHPNYAAYGTSKAGLNGFIRQAGFELARDGITVNGVAPGVTLTEGARAALDQAAQDAFSALIPRGQAGEPEEIAHVLLMLAQAGASHITGQTIVVDGGQSLGSAFPRD